MCLDTPNPNAFVLCAQAVLVVKRCKQSCLFDADSVFSGGFVIHIDAEFLVCCFLLPRTERTSAASLSHNNLTVKHLY